MAHVFWFWLAWAGLGVLAWLRSPDLRAGLGQMRHSPLIAALFPTASRSGGEYPSNNVIQMASESGLPVTFAVFVFVRFYFKTSKDNGGAPMDRSHRFLSNTAVLGLLGFVVAGMFDYTFGH